MTPAMTAGAVGLLAGAGRLPEVLARVVRAQGRRVICAQMAGDPAGLPHLADVYVRLDLGTLQDLFRLWREHAVGDVLVAGRFSRADLASPRGDALMETFLRRVGDRRDQSFTEAFAALVAQMGMRVIDQATYAADLIPGPGILAGEPLAAAEERDVALGLPVARALAAHDVGQTIVLKNGVILAVEAAEGTDAVIRRGGAMARGAVVVKVSRPHQDPRFDIPVVGPETVDAMAAVGARVMALEARRTIVLDREHLAGGARAAGITVLAVDAPPLRPAAGP